METPRQFTETIVEKKETKFEPAELTSEEDLTQFWITFRKNNGLTVNNPQQELDLAHVKAKETLEKISKGNDIFYGVKKDGKIIATAMLYLIPERKELSEKPDHVWYAYLGFLTVDKVYRGNSIAKKMTAVRIERAKQEGAIGVTTHVFASNPQALATKFDDGFFIDHLNIEDGKLIGFHLRKDFEERQKSRDFQKSQLASLEEINLSETKAIQECIENGAIGIDIKNLKEVTDTNPAHWILILQK